MWFWNWRSAHFRPPNYPGWRRRAGPRVPDLYGRNELQRLELNGLHVVTGRQISSAVCHRTAAYQASAAPCLVSRVCVQRRVLGFVHTRCRKRPKASRGTSWASVQQLFFSKSGWSPCKTLPGLNVALSSRLFIDDLQELRA